MFKFCFFLQLFNYKLAYNETATPNKSKKEGNLASVIQYEEEIIL